MAPKPKKDLKLDAILSLWTDVSSTHELEEIYRKACQIAVDFLGADRSTFVLFDEALRDGTVRAEVVGSLPQGLDLPSALNMRIPLDGVPEEQALIKDGRALEYDIDQLQPGTFKDNLSALRVQSVLIVPVVWRDRILGSFSLDSVVYKRKFDEDARHLCDLLAAQIAVAIQNAKALAAERHRSDLLHKLEDYRDDLRRTDGNVELRRRVVELAVELCDWRSGALFMVASDSRDFVQMTSYDRHPERGNCQWQHFLKIPETSEHWLWQCQREQPAYVSLRRATHPEAFAREPMLQGTEHAVAIKLFDVLDCLLVVVDDSPSRDFADLEVECIVRFAVRAAGQLERQDRWDSVWEKLNLEFLHLLGPGPSNEGELTQLLHTFLTVVTASFGLKFNRAILFLLNEDRDALIPRMGIGHFDEKQWEANCWQDGNEGKDKFETWLQTAGRWTPTPLELWAQGQRPFALDGTDGPAFADVVQSPVVKILSSESQLLDLPSRVREKFRPTSTVVLAPLHTGLELIGVVMVDKEFTLLQIVQRDLLSLRIFCKQVALAIHNYLQPSRILGSLNRLFEECDVTTLQEMDEQALIRQIAVGTANPFKADAVGVLLADSQHRPRLWAFDREVGEFDPSQVFRQGGISQQVMRDGAVEVVEDVDPEALSPVLAAFGSKVAICLPLLLERRAIGVIWVLYRNRVGRRRIDSGTLQRYATEASLVYTNWLGVHGLAQERRAFQEIAGALSFQTAVTLMLDHTVSIFEAKTVTFWPFDSRRWRFSDPQVKGFDELLPRPAKGGATYRILKERGHIAIGDVTDPVAAKDLAPLTVQILRQHSLRSVQGISVYAGSEPLGVLYVAYEDARTFGFADVRRLENFAAGVATLLHVVRSWRMRAGSVGQPGR